MTTAQIRTLLEREVIAQMQRGRRAISRADHQPVYSWRVESAKNASLADTDIVAIAAQRDDHMDRWLTGREIAPQFRFATITEDCHVVYAATIEDLEPARERRQFASYQFDIADALGAAE